jgi:hypothetical protein
LRRSRSRPVSALDILDPIGTTYVAKKRFTVPSRQVLRSAIQSRLERFEAGERICLAFLEQDRSKQK